jgi:hypothetical protein
VTGLSAVNARATMHLVADLKREGIAMRRACDVLGLPSRSVFRWSQEQPYREWLADAELERRAREQAILEAAAERVQRSDRPAGG